MARLLALLELYFKSLIVFTGSYVNILIWIEKEDRYFLTESKSDVVDYIDRELTIKISLYGGHFL